MNLAIDFSDEADKTGFNRLKTRALLKAVKCSENISPEVTLGPNAAPSIWDSSPNGDSSRESINGLCGSMDLDITPIPKASSAKQRHIKVVRLNVCDIKEEPCVSKDVYYQKRILADLNQLSVQEAQAKMRLHLEKWEEHDEKVQELLAQRKAHQQAQDLARQQAKILEMARMQDEYIKKQQELDAAQAKRDREFYRRHEENKKHQLEVEKLQKEKVKKQADSVHQIFDCFSSFSVKYQEILEMFQRHEELKIASSCNLDVIRASHDKFNNLIAKCKLGQLNDDDVSTAHHVLNEVTAFYVQAKKEIEKAELSKKQERELQENLKRIEEENSRKKQEEENQIKSQGNNVLQETAHGEMRTDVVSRSKRYQKYLEVRKIHESVEKSLTEFSADESNKKFRRDCEKAVNIPLNAISPQCASHLQDKYKKLSSFLQNQTVVITEKRISAASHPMGSLYSMDYLALKTVKQGEQQVASNPEAAYPIAAVVIAIWIDLPEFGNLLLAQFYRASPYLIPAYWNQENSESDEDYYKRLGFKYTNNEQEDMDKFLKRQSGIMRLYCAIVVTARNKANRNKPHPLPPSDMWEWLTAFIALPPKADISATLLLEMLEVTGHLMMLTYSGQFRKLLHLICISYLPLVEKVTPPGRGGPVTRLRGFLEGLISGKSIPPPKGLLPSNFW